MCLTVSKKLFGIAKFQFKLLLTHNFIIAAALCALTPLLFGIRYLDSHGSSFVLERFVSLIGVILLTPLFMPEQDKNISELVQSKYTEHTATILLRLITSLLFMMFCIAAMIAAMQLLHGDFEIGKFLIGTFATAFALGATGFAFHAITNNVVIGYLGAFVYYLLNFSLGSRLGHFFLFSLARGSMTEKYWLIALGIILISASLIWKYAIAKTNIFK